MIPLVLLSLACSALATPLEPGMRSNATTCPACVLAKASTATQSVFPWLFNNNNARFMYARTDDSGWPIYQYFHNTKPMWLHFYDEGFFYDGFYVINDLEEGYEESEEPIIYNSDSDDCPEDTGRNWYYWSNRWIYDESIYIQEC